MGGTFNEQEDFVFDDVFKEAKKYGVTTIDVVSDYSGTPTPGLEKGHLDIEMVKKDIPDYKNRTVYISGPQLMVQNLKDMFKKGGAKKVITDFFPGYAEK